MAKLNILGLALTTPEPYKVGHICTNAEAAILNTTLTRGLAKGIYRELREVYASERTLQASEADQARIERYIAGYVRGFSEGHERLRAIEAEARRLARVRLESVLYRSGRKLSELAKDELEALLTAEAASASVWAEAQRRVDSLRALGAPRGLEELVVGEQGEQDEQ